MVEPEVLTYPISILSSNNEHFDDLAYSPPQPAREVEIAHSFREANDSNVTSGEINMVRFRTLGQKKFVPAADPPAYWLLLLVRYHCQL